MRKLITTYTLKCVALFWLNKPFSFIFWQNLFLSVSVFFFNVQICSYSNHHLIQVHNVYENQWFFSWDLLILHECGDLVYFVILIGILQTLHLLLASQQCTDTVVLLLGNPKVPLSAQLLFGDIFVPPYCLTFQLYT